MSEKMKTITWKIIGHIAMALSGFYIVKVLMTFDIDYSILKQPGKIFLLFLFSLSSAVLVYVSGFAWGRILNFISGKKIAFKEVCSVYVKANIGKYLPGGVMHFAGRNVLGKSLGLSHVQIAFSTVMEVLIVMAACTFWGLLLARDTFISILKDNFERYGWLLVWVSVLIIIIAAFLVYYFVLRSKKYRESLRMLLNPLFFKTCGINLIIYSAVLWISGCMLAFMISWRTPLLYGSSLMLIIAAYIVSWLIGFVVPGAPGGIGVREAVLILILGNLYAVDIILIAVLMQRFIMVLGDVLAYFSVVASSMGKGR